MEAIQNHYFLLIRKMALFLGVWHTQKYKERILRYCIIGSMLLSFIIIQLFCQLYSWDLNLRSLVFTLQYTIPDVCCVAEYVAVVMDFSKIRKVFSGMKVDWQQLKNDDELKIMQEHAYQFVVCTIVCGFVLFLFIGLLILPPVMRRMLSADGEIRDNDRFPIYFCLDHFLDPETLYYPLLIYETLFSIIVIFVAITSYSMYFMNVHHICSRLAIVKLRLNRPFVDDDDNKKPMELSLWMIDIIQLLTSIRESIKMINAAVEMSYLIQIALGFVVIVIDFLYLLQIPVFLEQEGGKNEVFMNMIFVLSNILPVYISCYIGQRLIDSSEDVYKEACLVPFHKISLETQKLLLMMLIMYAKPYSITIGKVFVSSHTFFSDLLRAALSFSMMLHSTQKM